MRTKLALILLLAVVAGAALLGCSARSGAGSADAGTQGGPAEPVEPREGDFSSGPMETTPAGERDVTEEELRARRAAELEAKLQDVFFAFDSSQLTWEARQALAEDARLLQGVTDLAVVLEGHCDERGTNEYNLALGDRRARSVRDYLVQAGVPASRLTLISYGEERPFALGHDEAAWSQNRRVHFRVR